MIACLLDVWVFLRGVACFLMAVALSTVLIRRGLPHLMVGGKPVQLPDGSPGSPVFDVRATGFWIGFFETLLIFLFAWGRELGAVAILIGAKEFVRRDKIADNPAFYLLGTLVNLSVALFFALLARP